MSRKSVALGALVIAAVVAPSLAFASSGYVSSRTAMRAGPDNGYPTVAVVRKGEGVELHACLSDWSWCDVGFNGQRGWLRADKIMGETVSGRVPVARAGRDLGIETRGYNLDQYWDTHYNGRFDSRRGHWQVYYKDHARPSWSEEH
jgi:uncharacterized protein YraI